MQTFLKTVGGLPQMTLSDTEKLETECMTYGSNGENLFSRLQTNCNRSCVEYVGISFFTSEKPLGIELQKANKVCWQ